MLSYTDNISIFGSGFFSHYGFLNQVRVVGMIAFYMSFKQAFSCCLKWTFPKRKTSKFSTIYWIYIA